MSIKLPQHYPVTCHTDHVGDGSTFVAIKGMKEDGVRYIPLALLKGATTIVVQDNAVLSSELELLIENAQAQFIRVPNARQALAQFSAHALQYPADRLKIIGVTGTKGKTTSVFLIEHILSSAGYRTALLSSVKNKILDFEFATGLTTQHPDYLHIFFDTCVKSGVEYVVLEVAAQALSLHRIDGIQFDAVLFTNFGQEHAEFYTQMNDYFEAKCMLFDQRKLDAWGIINSDDQQCAELENRYGQLMTFGFDPQADVVIMSARNIPTGLTCAITIHNKTIAFDASLVGRFNAYNIAGALAVTSALGINPRYALASISSFDNVPGRFERYNLPNGARCIIDYASNPSSFNFVLSTLRELTDHLIVVFGAGGDRDITKRPVMGAIAAKFADVIILTTDNPRSEEPAHIIENIIAGIDNNDRYKVMCELDREQAIKKAYALANNDSIIALLGKGAEEYQLIQETKIPFSEKLIIQTLQ